MALYVFDFDHTLVDDNSDTFVFERLSDVIFKEQRELRATVQWTRLMDAMMGRLVWTLGE
jgi:pyridoxal phosphate phosphatase PHOSPHO2